MKHRIANIIHLSPKSMKQFLIVVVVALTTANGSPFSGSSWSSFLNAPDGIFPSDLSAPPNQSKKDVRSSFEKMLNDSDFLKKSYSNYRRQFGNTNEFKIGVGSIEAFKENLVKILSHNLKAANGESSYEMGVNQFADMTTEEIDGAYRGCLKEFIDFGLSGNASSQSTYIEKSPLTVDSELTAPESLDWRQRGVVTPVKYQQKCGSCVYFAAIGALEAVYAISHNKEQTDLSEQELIDCAKGNGNNGCSGGTFVPTFDYLKSKGVTTEQQYPYEDKDGSCRSSGKPRKAKITKWAKANKEGDENGLKESVAKYGPIAIAIHVSDKLALYHNGIFEGPCEGGRNHAVSTVGYGSENGKDYWIVRNSWGDTWGEKGYIRIKRNAGNLCDVAGDTIFMKA